MQGSAYSPRQNTAILIPKHKLPGHLVNAGNGLQEHEIFFDSRKERLEERGEMTDTDARDQLHKPTA